MQRRATGALQAMKFPPEVPGTWQTVIEAYAIGSMANMEDCWGHAPDQSGGDMNDDTERIHVQGFFPSRWLEVRENCAGFGLPACH